MQPFFRFLTFLGFMKEMTLWKSLCERTVEIFVSMSEYLQANDYEFEGIKSQAVTHCTNLQSKI